MQLVGRLEQQSGNIDGSCRVAKQILDFFELHVGDYKMNQVQNSTSLHIRCTCTNGCIVRVCTEHNIHVCMCVLICSISKSL